MKPKNQSLIDCNVRVIVLDKNKKVKQDCLFKNTATKRMTDGIAMFLAGDAEAYARGKWRPNFISFGTTGIDKQPTEAGGLATVKDPLAFSETQPSEGVRTRPWFYSQSLGERSDGFWNPDFGWGTPSNPDEPVFQGELVTGNIKDENKIISRHPLLRADVTNDYSYERQVGQEGYSTDCILYGYSSVLWNKQFFEPEHGPKIPRIAISEVGLYECDSFPAIGLNTLLAGFRVPTVDDIIYIDPGEVVLVEWRITVRAIMPYETVKIREDKSNPTGIQIKANLIQERTVQYTAFLTGNNLKNQDVYWDMKGNESDFTRLTEEGLLTVDKEETSPVLYITARSAANPEISATTATLTGLITDYVMGITLTTVELGMTTIQYQAVVLGKGNYITTVEWSLTGNNNPDTNITPSGLLTISEDEDSEIMEIKATSTDNPKIFSVACLLKIDRTKGRYTVSDFSILTE